MCKYSFDLLHEVACHTKDDSEDVETMIDMVLQFVYGGSDEYFLLG